MSHALEKAAINFIVILFIALLIVGFIHIANATAFGWIGFLAFVVILSAVGAIWIAC